MKTLTLFLVFCVAAGAYSQEDPLYYLKQDDLKKVIMKLKFWQEEVPEQINKLATHLNDLRNQKTFENWKMRAKNDPPPEFPQIPRLQKEISRREEEAKKAVEALLFRKAQIEMSIQMHNGMQWHSLYSRISAGECTSDEIDTLVAGRDKEIVKKIFGPPQRSMETSFNDKYGHSIDGLVFGYADKIKNKDTGQSEDLWLYFDSNKVGNVCIGRRLGMSDKINFYDDL